MASPDLLYFNRLCPLLAMALLGCICARAASNTNPADELADLINNNRTSRNLPTLADNSGLACIALQYVHDFQQQCDQVGKEKPPASLLNTTFAANCGVDPTTVTPLTGQLVYCQSTYIAATEAWTKLVTSDSNKSMAILGDTENQEMGVAVGSYGGGSPYYWAALFSKGSLNTTFLFSSGKPLMQHEGCFSGTGEPCSASSKLLLHHTSLLLVAIATSLLISPSLLALS